MWVAFRRPSRGVQLVGVSLTLTFVGMGSWACGDGRDGPAPSRPSEGAAFGLRVQSPGGEGAVLEAAVRIDPPAPEAQWAPLLALRLSRAFASCDRAAPGHPTSLAFRVRDAVPQRVRAMSDDELARCMAAHWPRDVFDGISRGVAYHVEVRLLPAPSSGR